MRLDADGLKNAPAGQARRYADRIDYLYCFHGLADLFFSFLSAGILVDQGKNEKIINLS